MRSDYLERIDFAKILVDMGFEDVDPEAEEQLLFCVFHADSGTRSFSVNLQKKVYHCFSPACSLNSGGNAIMLYALWKGLTYEHALQEIQYLPKQRSVEKLHQMINSRQESLSVNYRADVLTRFIEKMPLLSMTSEAEYLRSRGIQSAVMDEFGFRALRDPESSGIDPEDLFRVGITNVWKKNVFAHHPILFPFYLGKQVQFIQGRMSHEDPFRPKYLGLRGAIPCLFNHQALHELSPKTVYLCEGVLDAVSLHSLGYSPALGIVGASGFKSEWAKDFRYFGVEQVVIATDNDDAGHKAASDLTALISSAGCTVTRLAIPQQHKDANSWLQGTL